MISETIQRTRGKSANSTIGSDCSVKWKCSQIQMSVTIQISVSKLLSVV